MRRVIVGALFRLHSHRIEWIAVTVIIAISVGLVFGMLGNSYKPTNEQPIGNIGRIEVLRMPISARSLKGISSFFIQMKGGNDYGRVYVNNYLAINITHQERTFYSEPKGEKEEKLLTDLERRVVDRKEWLSGEQDVKHLLRKGTNYIVVEVGNSILETCGASLDIQVNARRLPGFPRIFPSGFIVEREAVNSELLKAYRRIRVSALPKALCSRRVFEFDLL